MLHTLQTFLLQILSLKLVEIHLHSPCLFLPPSWHVSLVMCVLQLWQYPANERSLQAPFFEFLSQYFHSLFRHCPIYLPDTDTASCSYHFMWHHFFRAAYIFHKIGKLRRRSVLMTRLRQFLHFKQQKAVTPKKPTRPEKH